MRVAVDGDQHSVMHLLGARNAPTGGAAPGDCGEKTPLVTANSRARVGLDALTQARPAVDTIVRYLRATDLASLSNVTPKWRQAVTDSMFDQASKAELAAREHGTGAPWPALVDSKFNALAHARSRRFQHAATFVNLHHAIENLPTLSLAGCRITEVPNMYLSARAPVCRHQGVWNSWHFARAQAQIFLSSLKPGRAGPPQDWWVIGRPPARQATLLWSIPCTTAAATMYY